MCVLFHKTLTLIFRCALTIILNKGRCRCAVVQNHAVLRCSILGSFKNSYFLCLCVCTYAHILFCAATPVWIHKSRFLDQIMSAKSVWLCLLIMVQAIKWNTLQLALALPSPLLASSGLFARCLPCHRVRHLPYSADERNACLNSVFCPNFDYTYVYLTDWPISAIKSSQ